MKTPIATLALAGFFAPLPILAATTLRWLPPDVASMPTGLEQLGGSSVELRVQLSGAADAPVTVEWATTAAGTATPGADFQVANGTLTFASSETLKTIKVPILDDGLQEFPETIGLRLINASGGVVIDGADTLALILDNEIPATLEFQPRKNPNLDRYAWLATRTPDGGMIRSASGFRLLKFDAKEELVSVSKPMTAEFPNDQCCSRLIPTSDDKVYWNDNFNKVNGIEYPGLVRVLLGGGVDPTFVPDPGLKWNLFWALGVQPDGRLLVSGDGSKIIRLTENGRRDETFRPIDLSAGGIGLRAILSSGALLLTVQRGESHLSWIRLLPNGEVDPTFQPAVDDCEPGHCESYPFPDGSILVVSNRPGNEPQRIRKMRPDGSLDQSFQTPAWISGLPAKTGLDFLAPENSPILPDGRVRAYVGHPGFGGIEFSVLLRSDGSLDPSFRGILTRSGLVNGRIVGPGNTSPRIRLGGTSANGIYASAGEWGVPLSDTRTAFNIVRAGDTTGSARVRYRTVDGTAQAGRDYVAAAGELAFAPYEVAKELQFTITSSKEVTRSFKVELSDAAGAEIQGAPTLVTIFGKAPSPPAFAEVPLQILRGGVALINSSQDSGWRVEYSQNLRDWSLLEDGAYDFEAATSSARFYRLRKP